MDSASKPQKNVLDQQENNSGSHENVSQPQKKAPEPSVLPPPQYAQGTPVVLPAAMRPITLPDGTVAYIPEGGTPPQGVYNYGYNYNQPLQQQNGPLNTAAGEGNFEPVGCCGDPSRCRRLASRAIVVSFTAVALALSIAAAGVSLSESDLLDRYWGNGSYYCSVCSAILFVSLAFSIPALVLASIFVHIGRKYPLQDAADRHNGSLTEEQRRDRYLTRAVYDANITKALFSTLLVSTVLVGLGCGFAFAGEYESACSFLYYYGYGGYYYWCGTPHNVFDPPVSAPLTVVAVALFLVVTILTPIAKATGGSLCFPAEVEKRNGGKGCCFYCK